MFRVTPYFLKIDVSTCSRPGLVRRKAEWHEALQRVHKPCCVQVASARAGWPDDELVATNGRAELLELAGPSPQCYFR